MLIRLMLLLCGVFACSTAVIFIKLSNEQAIWLASERLFVAAVALSPLLIRDWKKYRERLSFADLKLTFAPGAILALHFISWIYGAKMAASANASLLVNLVPIAMPFFLFWMLGEKLSQQEWLGTGLALSGVFILGVADLKLSAEYFTGDLLCLFSMFSFCIYLVYGRRIRRIPSIWLYVVPVYFISALLCAISGLLCRIEPLGTYPPFKLAMIFALGIVPTVIGHTILNHSLQHLRGQIVGIVNELQFVFAGICAWLILGEMPHWPFYLAGLLVLGGVLTVLRK